MQLLQVPGIGNTELVPRRETSNIWKQPVGITRCSSLPSVHTSMYTEVKVYSSLPQLNVDDSTLQFTRSNSEQRGIDADIESGSDVCVVDTLHVHPTSTPLTSLQPDPKHGSALIESGSNNAASNEEIIKDVAGTRCEAENVSSLMSCEAPT